MLTNSRRRSIQICLTVFKHSTIFVCFVKDGISVSVTRMPDGHRTKLKFACKIQQHFSTRQLHFMALEFVLVDGPVSEDSPLFPCELGRGGFYSSCFIFLHFGDKQAEPRHTLKAQAAFNGYWIYRSSVLWDKCQFRSRKENLRITSRCKYAGQNLGSVIGGGAPEMPT